MRHDAAQGLSIPQVHDACCCSPSTTIILREYGAVLVDGEFEKLRLLVLAALVGCVVKDYGRLVLDGPVEEYCREPDRVSKSSLLLRCVVFSPYPEVVLVVPPAIMAATA